MSTDELFDPDSYRIVQLNKAGMKFIKVLLIIFCIPLILLITGGIFGLIHMWNNSGHKSLSSTDLHQLGNAIAINFGIVLILYLIHKKQKAL